MLRYVENIICSELGDITILTDGHWTHSHQQALLHRSTVVRILPFNIKEKILHAAWRKPLSVFDHGYAESAQQTRREYNAVKRVLKEEKIRFQTPLTRMRVHFHSGTVTYHSAEQAAGEDADSLWDGTATRQLIRGHHSGRIEKMHRGMSNTFPLPSGGIPCCPPVTMS